MKIYILIAVVFAAWSSSATAQDTKTTADNPIKAEMRLLNDAFHNLINSLILNNPKAVEEPFHAVHRARQIQKRRWKGEMSGCRKITIRLNNLLRWIRNFTKIWRYS